MKTKLKLLSLLAAVCVITGCNGNAVAETTTVIAAQTTTTVTREELVETKGEIVSKINDKEIAETVEIANKIYTTDLEELTLYIDNKTDITELYRLKNLKHLSLYSAIPEQNIEYFEYESIKELKSLESLSLRFVTFKNSGKYDFDFLNSLPSLKEVEIDWDGSVSFDCLREIEDLTKLTLYIDSSIDISDIGTLSNLKELKLMNKSIYDYGYIKNIDKISEIEGLECLSLYLVKFNEDTNLHFDFLYGMNNLSKIELGWYTLEDWSFLSNLSNIQDLTLFRCNIANIDFVNEMKSLKNLTLYNTKITDYSCLLDNYIVETLTLCENDNGEVNYDFSGISHLNNLKCLSINENILDENKYNRDINLIKSSLKNCKIVEGNN